MARNGFDDEVGFDDVEVSKDEIRGNTRRKNSFTNNSKPSYEKRNKDKNRQYYKRSSPGSRYSED